MGVDEMGSPNASGMQRCPEEGGHERKKEKLVHPGTAHQLMHVAAIGQFLPGFRGITKPEDLHPIDTLS
jgi:hypothetical protein